MVSGVPTSQSSLGPERTRVGIKIDRGATGVEVVSQELRTSIAINGPAKFVRCPGTACWHVEEAHDMMMVVARPRVRKNDGASSW